MAEGLSALSTGRALLYRNIFFCFWYSFPLEAVFIIPVISTGEIFCYYVLFLRLDSLDPETGDKPIWITLKHKMEVRLYFKLVTKWFYLRLVCSSKVLSTSLQPFITNYIAFPLQVRILPSVHLSQLPPIYLYTVFTLCERLGFIAMLTNRETNCVSPVLLKKKNVRR
jgi:hypothetical protein